MAITAYFYDAEGHDRLISIKEADLEAGSMTILWIDLSAPTADEVADVATKLKILEQSITQNTSAPETSIQNFGSYLAFFLTLPTDQPASADRRSNAKERETIGFVIGENWIITVHDGDAPLLDQFRDKDRAETLIGALSPAALVASLMDWHLGAYFDAATNIASEVDSLDERVLRDQANKSLLGRIVTLRRKLSRLRTALVINRPVFYGLSRADCSIVAQSDAAQHYTLLAGRFERALDEIERVRDLINGSFELFASRSGLQTNNLVKALTVITAVLGYFGATAGLFGMNLKSTLFNGGDGTFATIILTLIVTSALAIIIARARKWL